MRFASGTSSRKITVNQLHQKYTRWLLAENFHRFCIFNTFLSPYTSEVTLQSLKNTHQRKLGWLVFVVEAMRFLRRYNVATPEDEQQHFPGKIEAMENRK